jgi:ATP synthase F1 gamma subunit
MPRRCGDLLGYLVPQVPADLRAEMPLLQVRGGDRVALVVLTSDRGLCGSYNHNVIREAVSFLERHRGSEEPELLILGRKGTDYFRKRGYRVTESFAALDENSPFSEVQVVTQAVTRLYTRAEDPVDRLHIAYTQFVSTSLQRPQVIQFLPVEPRHLEAEEAPPVEYLLEPEARKLLPMLLPRFVDNQLYQYLLEAIASEHAARMIAMTNAHQQCHRAPGDPDAGIQQGPPGGHYQGAVGCRRRGRGGAVRAADPARHPLLERRIAKKV